MLSYCCCPFNLIPGHSAICSLHSIHTKPHAYLQVHTIPGFPVSLQMLCLYLECPPLPHWPVQQAPKCFPRSSSITRLAPGGSPKDPTGVGGECQSTEYCTVYHTAGCWIDFTSVSRTTLWAPGKQYSGLIYPNVVYFLSQFKTQYQWISNNFHLIRTH